ncbi:hypothetical protein Tco_0913934 [Tanacetum coccineum]
MATMVENVIVACSENRPPVLEKGMYDSWKTRIMLYIQGKENGELLIDSINGPVKLLPEITVKDTDGGVTDIRLPQKVADLSQEKKESIHSYYLRYDKLINDMKMISMSMLNMQINTKFVNHLQPKWSRFVTTAKQARDLHSVNFDQFYAFLKHNEKDAKEVREMRQ